jgi:hypothetical protein
LERIGRATAVCYLQRDVLVERSALNWIPAIVARRPHHHSSSRCRTIARRYGFATLIQSRDGAAAYFGGAVPDRLLVVAEDAPPFESWVTSMLKPIAARIKGTIAALPIHIARISFFSSCGLVIASSFFGSATDLFETTRAVQKHSVGLYIERQPERANCHLYSMTSQERFCRRDEKIHCVPDRLCGRVNTP